MEKERILTLPGNLRYQPKQMKEFFGYDNLYWGLAKVEIAVLKTLGEIGKISAEDFAIFTEEIEKKLLSITTTEVDGVEREVTKHDVRAWVRIAQGITGARLGKWLHIPLTSYDSLDTGRILQFLAAYKSGLKPSIKELVIIFSELVEKYSATLQIGRTHGQHALPITVGFWLATILNRVVYNWEQIDNYSRGLAGKISGAVGAYNAQTGLGFGRDFEEKVLKKLGLTPAKISTQILPPEPLAHFLFACSLLAAALAQFGRDCRNLMRSEIAEISEPFKKGQVGSSTMAHKINPINFENIEGIWLKTKNEFGKVMDTLISEHQRDLVGSSVARDFPIILINLQQQLNTLLAQDKEGIPFLKRITINEEICLKNFKMSSRLILAEPLYITLQLAGYQGDGHKFVSQELVPAAKREGISLIDVLVRLAEQDPALQSVIKSVPENIWQLLRQPEQYTGLAKEKAMAIAGYAKAMADKL